MLGLAVVRVVVMVVAVVVAMVLRYGGAARGGGGGEVARAKPRGFAPRGLREVVRVGLMPPVPVPVLLVRSYGII